MREAYKSVESSSILEKVNRGAASLDRYFPGWWKKVDPIHFLERDTTLFYILNVACGGIEEFYNASKGFKKGTESYVLFSEFSRPSDIDEFLDDHGFYAVDWSEETSESELPEDWQIKKEGYKKVWMTKLHIIEN